MSAVGTYITGRKPDITYIKVVLPLYEIIRRFLVSCIKLFTQIVHVSQFTTGYDIMHLVTETDVIS